MGSIVLFHEVDLFFYMNETFKNLKKKMHMHCPLSVLKCAFFQKLSFFPYFFNKQNLGRQSYAI